jgi:hypothetical protein
MSDISRTGRQLLLFQLGNLSNMYAYQFYRQTCIKEKTERRFWVREIYQQRDQKAEFFVYKIIG